MAKIEDHVEHHDREEFGSCAICDQDFYDVRNRLERHVEQWASTWAKQAAELYQEREQTERKRGQKSRQGRKEACCMMICSPGKEFRRLHAEGFGEFENVEQGHVPRSSET
jgi:hypothetical protein